ncbi:MAG TPA: hypothetical protein VGL13_03780, partial [Polyangiaceae bacterium]
GVDEKTWLFHLKRGDYSSWFRSQIKDDMLAHQAEDIEKQHGGNADASRAAIRQAIEERYTLPG